jgi:hypothetical protein
MSDINVTPISPIRKNGGVPPETKAAFKRLIKLVALFFLIVFGTATLIGIASAQTTQRTYQDSMGRNVGRSTTDAQGRSTFYDNMGRNTGRSETQGNTTTFYDNMGRQTGRSTK